MKTPAIIALIVIAVTFAACKPDKDLPSPICPTNTEGPQMNAFSPNGDGRNDRYRILADSAHPITSMELRIFNASEEEVAVIFGAQGSWDGKDSRTGNLSAPGRYRVEFGVTSSGHGQFEISADGETYIYLLGTSASGCLMSMGCPDSSYVFEDQFDHAKGVKSFPTSETFCK